MNRDKNVCLTNFLTPHPGPLPVEGRGRSAGGFMVAMRAENGVRATHEPLVKVAPEMSFGCAVPSHPSPLPGGEGAPLAASGRVQWVQGRKLFSPGMRRFARRISR